MGANKTVVIKGSCRQESAIKAALERFDPKQAALTYSVLVVEETAEATSSSPATGTGTYGLLIVPTSGELDG
jgi:hypothetical protein